MMQNEPTVFVVDDDDAMCAAVRCLLESYGLSVRTFPSAERFLSEYESGQPGCLVLDIRMRGMSGLELQAHLARNGLAIPVIIITGHGDVPMAVQAVQAGAIDFLEKPVSDQVLLNRIHRALARDAETRTELAERTARAAGFRSLTPREHEVMELVLQGLSNKGIASALKISLKTVEVHRHRVMRKMGVRGAIELLRAVYALPDSLEEPLVRYDT